MESLQLKPFINQSSHAAHVPTGALRFSALAVSGSLEPLAVPRCHGTNRTWWQASKTWTFKVVRPQTDYALKRGQAGGKRAGVCPLANSLPRPNDISCRWPQSMMKLQNTNAKYDFDHYFMNVVLCGWPSFYDVFMTRRAWQAIFSDWCQAAHAQIFFYKKRLHTRYFPFFEPRRYSAIFLLRAGF